jgi:hypothetical protein
MQNAINRLVVTFGFLGFGFAALAGTPEIRSGEYVMDGDLGKLTITKTTEGVAFQLYAESGAPGYTCQFSGTILNGRTTLDSDDDSEDCQVTFKATGDYVEVHHNSAPSCHSYCGSNADFDGLVFQRAKAECSRPSQTKSRNEFKRLYGLKSYSEARSVLETLLAKCEGVMQQIDVAWVRNDLALSQYRANDRRACLQTLQPLSGDAAMSDEDIRRAHSFVVGDDGAGYLAVIKATRTNLALCKN